MSGVVYILCALTSFICAVLLFRGFGRSGVRLLLWSGCCFIGLALNNALLFVDLELIPEQNLFLWRSAPAVIGVLLLLYGLIWEEF